jgi:hypothetical protein
LVHIARVGSLVRIRCAVPSQASTRFIADGNNFFEKIEETLARVTFDCSLLIKEQDLSRLRKHTITFSPFLRSRTKMMALRPE